jgi:hypothetical protein
MQIGTHAATERPDDRDRCSRQGPRRRCDLWCRGLWHHFNVGSTNDNTRALVSASGGHAGVCRPRLHLLGKGASRWLKARWADLARLLGRLRTHGSLVKVPLDIMSLGTVRAQRLNATIIC